MKFSFLLVKPFLRRSVFTLLASVAMKVTCQPLSEIYVKKFEKIFNIPNVFHEYNPGRFVFTAKFNEITSQILDFKVRPDDIWLVSYPRTGSTWCQEMVWTIGHELDLNAAKKTVQHLRAPLIEFSAILVTEEYKPFIKEFGNSVTFLDNLPSPRFIKSHLPMELLPTELQTVRPKIVYIARNPKDTVVSYYNYFKLLHNLDTTFEDFCELFLNDKLPCGPIWNHYLGFWKKRHDSNVLFLKFEDMKRDLKGTIKQTAAFLEKTLDDEQTETLCDHLNFNSMKKNPAVNLEPIMEKTLGKDHFEKAGQTFIRKGEIGDWKNYMSPELSQRFDEWIESSSEGTELTF